MKLWHMGESVRRVKALRAVWSAFWAIARKEVLHVRMGALSMLILMQCMDFGMMAWIDVTIRDLPTVLVDQDHTAESREFIARVRATHTFKIKYLTSSTEQARGHLRAGRAKAAIVIPPDYGRARSAGTTAQILALVDGSDAATGGQVTGAIEGLAASMDLIARTEEIGPRPPTIESHSVLLFNPEGRTANFMLPGLLGIILGSGYSYRSLWGLLSEREAGNLERLLMTPISYTGLVLGKIAPWFAMGVVNALVYCLVIRWGFGVPLRGSTALLLLSIALYVLTVVSLGSFIGAGAGSVNDAFALWGFIPLLSTFLSGYIFPLASIPKPLLLVAYALPHTHFIELMRGICLRGASAADLAPHLAFLAIAPIVLTIGSARRFSRSVMQ
jgi:ABC-2 type transport system permease protein